MALSRRALLGNGVAALFAASFPPGAAAATNHVVEIRRFKFDPAMVEARPGDTITWINRDIVPHTATALNESWDTRRLGRRDEGSISVTSGMPTDYFCKFHPQMKGRIKLV